MRMLSLKEDTACSFFQFKMNCTIKDTRTKSRGREEVAEGGGTGRGGVQGWGENADNCN